MLSAHLIHTHTHICPFLPPDIQTRLRLDLSPAQASAFITALARQSAASLVPQVMDRVHEVANYFR